MTNNYLNKKIAIAIRSKFGIDHYDYHNDNWDNACEGVESMLINIPHDELINALDDVLDLIWAYNTDEDGCLTWGDDE
jgi:hypothetical protein